MRALALAAALAACGGGGGDKASTTPKKGGVDEAKAEKGAKDLVGEIYEDLGHADTDSLQPPLSAQLVVFGPRRADLFANRADALVALKQVVDPKIKKHVPLQSSGLSVVASPGGRSAWAVDTVEIDGQPLAVTAVLSNADDIWLVDVAALARTPAMKTVRAELKQDAVVPPAMAAPGKVDDGAAAAVDRFKAGLAAQSTWGDDLGSRSDAVVIGPGFGDVTRGKAEIKKMWKKRLKANTREAAAGEITAAATRDGQLAWVTAPVVRFADEEEPLPLRVFAVFEKNGSAWKLIALQESLAVDSPGAGAAFKKTPAPAAEKKAEPPPPAKPDAKAKKKTKPKKRPRPASDD